ncbi:MAG: DNA alkylation repair protein [Bacteroidales bacterium]|nr:DNA alkylation repair protein [Bacteroidales bacterium]
MKNNNLSVKNILKEIRANENGPAVDAMERMGLKYSRNFGVSIADLKRIATKYKFNHEIADMLREKNIRETRILAEMIEDSNLVSEEKADKIVSNIDTNELAEQSCLNLFEKLDFADKKAEEWILSEHKFTVVCGFILFSRIALNDKTKKNDFFIKAISVAENSVNNESVFIRKAIARALRQIALRNNNLKKQVLELTNKIKKTGNEYSKLIIEEVEMLIDF